jgi:signal transduction histidine kinase
MSMDIDKNKKMTKELLDVELLVEDGRMVIFKCYNDDRLSIKYISNSIKHYGYNKLNFEKHNINLKDIVIKEDKNTIQLAINEAIIKKQKSFSIVIRIVHFNKKIRWVFLRAILLKDDFSNVTQFYGYMYDITKIKISEEELKLKVQIELQENIKKDRLLVQQNKLASMGEMLGNIAHQWRQPLNTINLIIHFIRDNYDNDNFTKEQLEKYINKSKTQIDYMSQTIDDFRNFYKPSKIKNKFNIKHTIQDVTQILNAQLKDNGIKIIKNIEDINIINYENELKQSLLNIINNAKDAIVKKQNNGTFKGIINIVIKKQNNFVHIQIKNNAEHIKNDIIDKIFEPYFTTKFETQGTGIGLYMSRTIIETNMKGKISVKNTNYGVEFLILLPI